MLDNHILHTFVFRQCTSFVVIHGVASDYVLTSHCYHARAFGKLENNTVYRELSGFWTSILREVASVITSGPFVRTPRTLGCPLGSGFRLLAYLASSLVGSVRC